MRKRHTLERKMLSYFGLIAAASLLITVEFIWAIKTATPDPEVFHQSYSLSAQSLHKVTAALESLRDKALLMFVVQAVVTLIVLIMFMRRITGPLQQMVENSQVISAGDLSRTIPVRSRDEIGLLAETINGLTSNFQEIVALGLSTDASLRASLDDLTNYLQSDPQGLERVDEIREKLDGFRWIVDDFKLFPAPPADQLSGSSG